MLMACTPPTRVSSIRRAGWNVSLVKKCLKWRAWARKCCKPARSNSPAKYRVKTRVLSSLSDPLMPLEDEMRSGTLMTFEEDQTMEQVVVSGIAHQRDEARIAVL